MSPTSSFVVIAEFTVKPDSLEAFLALARDDAASSLASEPGCRVFDICVCEAQEAVVVFYEVYDDRAAFEAHLKTPHLARFRAGFPPLVITQHPVRFLTRISPKTEA